MSDEALHTKLRDALLEFVRTTQSRALDPFRDNMASGGEQWIEAPANPLPVARLLGQSWPDASPSARSLMTLFADNNSRLRWEQTYTQAEDSIGDDMVNGYGFVEIMGKWGPFVSDRVRSGVCVFGPRVNYPMHYHGAEEVYCLLSGKADFRFDDGHVERHEAGDMVYMRPLRHHGFRVLEESVVMFYIWQAGDLREKSTFVE